MLASTYQYKLIPDRQQIKAIDYALSVCLSIWNYTLERGKNWLTSSKLPFNICSSKEEYIIPYGVPYPNCHKQSQRLTKTNKIINTGSAQVLKQVLRVSNEVFFDMQFRKLYLPRSKHKYRMRSYKNPQILEKYVEVNQIKLPQLEWVKLRRSINIQDGFELIQACILRGASGYLVMFSMQLKVNIPDVPFHWHPLEIGLRLDKLCAICDGELVDGLQFLNQPHRKIEWLQLRLKNKQKESNNRYKLNQKIARLCRRISDTRRDWYFKLVSYFVDQAQSAFIENIDFQSWGRRILSKDCLEDSFKRTITILKLRVWKRDVFIPKVYKNFTSHIHINYGFHTGKNTFDVRKHNCPGY
ncbi:MAG: RNA-guided endonuclease InsQ/TnpB family protein [cyanobacterium endosymbiont of Rhopalodia musculus]|uniref:RNA-guided endonuclease InsQ/TnpB family protein n=1 Tax=cyanobacterium endosymbiont of Epithemia clementina EcSB TaxID=3034674 RepID=UPI0024816FEA|nr:transposase [cyanobacterium endosymbiont of Epithemia clementina EcSB]WGT66707.1 transposase [cyanobacterium endosymbiont of Epithemia clementina EcSB]